MFFSCPVRQALYTVVVGGANSSNFSRKTRQLSACKYQAQAFAQFTLQPGLAGASFHWETAKGVAYPMLHHFHHVLVSGFHITLLTPCPNVKNIT